MVALVIGGRIETLLLAVREVDLALPDLRTVMQAGFTAPSALPSTRPRRRAACPRMCAPEPIETTSRPASRAPLAGPEAVVGVGLAGGALIGGLARRVAAALMGSFDAPGPTALDGAQEARAQATAHLDAAKEERRAADERMDAAAARASAAEAALAGLGGLTGAAQRAAENAEAGKRKEAELAETRRKLAEAHAAREEAQKDADAGKEKRQRAAVERDALAAQMAAAAEELAGARAEAAKLAKAQAEADRQREQARAARATAAAASDEAAAAERALGELRRGLRAADEVAASAAKETETARALLGVRQVELRELSARVADVRPGPVGGGDPKRSARELKGVEEMLDAGGRELSARVRLAEMDVRGKESADVDPLTEVAERVDKAGQVLSAEVGRASVRLAEERESEEERRRRAEDVLRDLSNGEGRP